MEDPSLIIYYPVRKFENKLIVTNGDQTDTVFQFLKEGKSFEQALDTRCFEPDGPNWTPRISGMIDFGEDSFTYKMSILKSGDPEGSSCFRYYYNYEKIAGLGHFLHTICRMEIRSRRSAESRRELPFPTTSISSPKKYGKPR